MLMVKTQNKESVKRKTRYYEVSNSMVSRLGSKYFVFTSYEKPIALSYASDRIWEWDRETDSIRYIKYRRNHKVPEVDRKEFLLIQLQAKELK